MSPVTDIINELVNGHNTSDENLLQLICTEDELPQLTYAADKIRRDNYGTDVYIRGLIEFTNYCRNSCYYCGINARNKKVQRFRLYKQDILSCCDKGYPLGFRTFVLQGGEDPYYTDDIICDIVYSIRDKYPDCAVTLSIGEKPRKSYQAYYNAGASRFLLRHETADSVHYNKLHPSKMSLENRKRCLYELKDIGFQTGSGFMVGSPFQSAENLVSDLRFLQELSPDMIGIGPFIPHSETVFADCEQGSLKTTLKMISILRLMFPYALIPSTTALGTIHPDGRELGLKAGGNVIMPNLSPDSAKLNYTLYNNKLCTGDEAAEQLESLKIKVRSAGYEIVTDIGNVKR